MNNYYYLATALPDLKIGEQPDITMTEFDTLLHDNLTSGTYREVLAIRRYYDILNLRSFWRGEGFVPFGNMDPQQLEEALIEIDPLPSYVKDYLETYVSTKERLDNFNGLLATFFREEIKETSGLVKKYLEFERKLRLVWVAFRAKKLHKDIYIELQHENPDEDIIAQILAQKDAKEFFPPEEFEELKEIFDKYGDKPLDLHQAITQFRFDKVQQMMGLKTFNLSYIEGYTIQLLLVEQWLQLNKEKGIQIVENIVKGTK